MVNNLFPKQLHRLNAACKFGSKTRTELLDVCHQQLITSDKDLTLFLIHSLNNLVCSLLRRNATSLTSIHLAVLLAILLKGVFRNICLYTTRTNNRDTNILVVGLGLNSLEETIQRVLCRAISATQWETKASCNTGSYHQLTATTLYHSRQDVLSQNYRSIVVDIHNLADDTHFRLNGCTALANTRIVIKNINATKLIPSLFRQGVKTITIAQIERQCSSIGGTKFFATINHTFKQIGFKGSDDYARPLLCKTIGSSLADAR